jgi:hypothetical protein
LMEGVKMWLSSQVYKNLFLNIYSWILTVTTLRSSLRMYVFLVYNKISFSRSLVCYKLTRPCFPNSLSYNSVWIWFPYGGSYTQCCSRNTEQSSRFFSFMCT